LTLTRIFPNGDERCVLTETIYRCLYAKPAGELRRELIDGFLPT
jgi:hypothetical protein